MKHEVLMILSLLINNYEMYINSNVQRILRLLASWATINLLK